jgi:hypothetical protein
MKIGKTALVLGISGVAVVLAYVYFKKSKNDSAGGESSGNPLSDFVNSIIPISEDTANNPTAGASNINPDPLLITKEQADKAKADILAKEQQLASNFKLAVIASSRIKKLESDIYDLSKGIINNQEQIKINEAKAQIEEQKLYMKTLGFYLPAGGISPKKI